MIIRSNLNKRSEDNGYDVMYLGHKKRRWRKKIPRRAPRERQEKRMRLSLTLREKIVKVTVKTLVRYMSQQSSTNTIKIGTKVKFDDKNLLKLLMPE